MKFLGTILSFLTIAGWSHASCRPLQFNHHGHHYRQAVILQQYQPAYYKVGADVQTFALLRLAAEQGAAEALKKQGAVANMPVPNEEIATPAHRLSIVQAECVKCHAKPDSAASQALDMSDLAALTCDQKLACVKAVMDGKMPKGKTLDAQTLGNLVGQLVGADTAPQ